MGTPHLNELATILPLSSKDHTHHLVLRFTTQDIHIIVLSHTPLWGFTELRYYREAAKWETWLNNILSDHGFEPIDEVKAFLLRRGYLAHATTPSQIADFNKTPELLTDFFLKDLLIKQLVPSQLTDITLLFDEYTPQRSGSSKRSFPSYFDELAHVLGFTQCHYARYTQSFPMQKTLETELTQQTLASGWKIKLAVVDDTDRGLEITSVELLDTDINQSLANQPINLQTANLYLGRKETQARLILWGEHKTNYQPQEILFYVGDFAPEAPTQAIKVCFCLNPHKLVAEVKPETWRNPGPITNTLNVTTNNLRHLYDDIDLLEKSLPLQLAFLLDGTLDAESFADCRAFIYEVVSNLRQHRAPNTIQIACVIYGEHRNPPITTSQTLIEAWNPNAFETYRFDFVNAEQFYRPKPVVLTEPMIDQDEEQALVRIDQALVQFEGMLDHIIVLDDGSDYCNALELGLQEINTLSWSNNPNHIRHLVLIGNSPPHPTRQDQMRTNLRCIPANAFARNVNWLNERRSFLDNARSAGVTRCFLSSIWIDPDLYPGRKPDRAEREFCDRVWKSMGDTCAFPSLPPVSSFLSYLRQQMNRERFLRSPLRLPLLKPLSQNILIDW